MIIANYIIGHVVTHIINSQPGIFMSHIKMGAILLEIITIIDIYGIVLPIVSKESMLTLEEIIELIATATFLEVNISIP